MNVFLHILLIFTAFGGFLLSFYIRHKKHSHEKMICPLKSNCDTVIYSPYSKFFGVPLELLGLLYYGLIAVGYALFLIFPTLATPLVVFGVLFATTAALLFSLYLIFIQAFTLKQWCTWCLMSAGLCVIIFATALSISELGFISLLAEHHDLIVILHIFGVALGLGGATIADIFFFKFLKDLRISEWEAGILHTLSQIIWFALAILVLSGIGLYLPEAQELNQSSKFLVKMVVVFVLILNGAFLNLLIAPKLVKISFGQKHHHQTGELHHIRKLAFALGAISLVSWYSAFILGMLRFISIDFLPLLLIYVGILSGAVIASQLLERSFAKRSG